MPKGIDTGQHSGRKVHRERFDTQPEMEETTAKAQAWHYEVPEQTWDDYLDARDER